MARLQQCNKKTNKLAPILHSDEQMLLPTTSLAAAAAAAAAAMQQHRPTQLS